jgi:2-methylisocitrate lyase-like PEP mutase family enzyme
MHRAMTLRELLSSGETLVMPDAYDPLSARIIEKLGFKAIQCSGFSMALAACVASEAAFGLERNLAATAAIVKAVDVPVMADGEDGFGDVSAIPGTIRAYVEAGVAGINIEDQVLGLPGPKQVIALSEAVEKLQAARRTATEAGVPELIINGRTDALAASPNPEQGLAEAIARSNAYLEAEADLAFITGVDDLEQVKLLVREINGPISIAAGMPNNIGNFSVAQLREAGVARVSLPSLLVFSAIKAMSRSLHSVQETEGFEKIVGEDMICGMGDVMALLTP